MLASGLASVCAADASTAAFAVTLLRSCVRLHAAGCSFLAQHLRRCTSRMSGLIVPTSSCLLCSRNKQDQATAFCRSCFTSQKYLGMHLVFLLYQRRPRIGHVGGRQARTPVLSCRDCGAAPLLRRACSSSPMQIASRRRAGRAGPRLG